MLYLTYAPGLPISEFVDYFWLFDGGQTLRKERIVPSGIIELVINLRDDEIRIHNRAQSKQHNTETRSELYNQRKNVWTEAPRIEP